MNFFVVNSRQDYASYSPDASTEEINEPRISAYDRRVAHRLEEYLGDPPRKPGKHGDFHMSSFMYFVRTNALRFFETAAREKLLTRPIAIVGRQSEEFRQIWVTNFIDCLDLNRTIASPPLKEMSR